MCMFIHRAWDWKNVSSCFLFFWGGGFALKGSPVHTNHWRRFSSLTQRQSRLLYPPSVVSCRWTGARQAAVGRRGAFAHRNEHICPFTPTSQFMRFWTSCLHPCMAFGDKWCAWIRLFPINYSVTSRLKLGREKRKKKNQQHLALRLGEGREKKKRSIFTPGEYRGVS